MKNQDKNTQAAEKIYQQNRALIDAGKAKVIGDSLCIKVKHGLWDVRMNGRTRFSGTLAEIRNSI